jgi:RNA polymerase-binding transcription factor DksA
MTQREIQSFRRRLLELKKRLGAEFSALEEEALKSVGGETAGGLSDVPIHPADLGTDNFEEEITLDLLENEDRILDELNDALERIEEGTFGRCENCRREIPGGLAVRALLHRVCAATAGRETRGELTARARVSFKKLTSFSCRGPRRFE